MWRPSAAPAVPEGWPATTHAGEANGHGGSFARRATEGDRPAMFFDNLFHGGQAQASARSLGREEGFKDFVEDLGRDWRSVVLDKDLDFDAAPRTMLRDLDMEMAARGHGLAGVFEDAQEDLLELRFIGTHRGNDVGVVFGDVNTGDFQVGSDDDEGVLQDFRHSTETPGEFQWLGKVQDLVQDRLDSDHVTHRIFDACLRIEVENPFAGYLFELRTNGG